jgi:hypothetical protein
MNYQNYWVSGLFASSVILQTRKHVVSETASVCVLMWGRRHLLCSVLIQWLRSAVSKGLNWLGVLSTEKLLVFIIAIMTYILHGCCRILLVTIRYLFLFPSHVERFLRCLEPTGAMLCTHTLVFLFMGASIFYASMSDLVRSQIAL